MSKIFVISLFSMLFALFFAPQFALAAGLVPCQGVVGTVGGATSLGCSLCDLAKLTNNVINWLVNMSFVMAVLFTVYGGYLIMTAGLSPKQYEAGKDVILAVVIGLAIVLTSWIIINTALKFLTGSENWYHVDCGVGTGAATPAVDNTSVTIQPILDESAAIQKNIDALTAEKQTLISGNQASSDKITAYQTLLNRYNALAKERADLVSVGLMNDITRERMKAIDVEILSVQSELQMLAPPRVIPESERQNMGAGSF